MAGERHVDANKWTTVTIGGVDYQERRRRDEICFASFRPVGLGLQREREFDSQSSEANFLKYI